MKIIVLFLILVIQVLPLDVFSMSMQTSSGKALAGLEGTGKGQTAQGLHKVKQYLYGYGYLNDKDFTSSNESNNKDYHKIQDPSPES